jgi:hypothetical protein
VAAINAEERAFQERLELAVLDVLTNGSIPTEDLSHWNLRSYAFKNIDEHISRACDGPEKPNLERFFLLLTMYKCLNRLLEPPKAPVKRQLSPTEQLYREQQSRKVNQSSDDKKGNRIRKPQSGIYRRRMESMTEDTRREFLDRQIRYNAAHRARKASITPQG